MATDSEMRAEQRAQEALQALDLRPSPNRVRLLRDLFLICETEARIDATEQANRKVCEVFDEAARGDVVMDAKHCRGCEDDFYNVGGAGNHLTPGRQCWSLKRAKLVTRFRIGTWTQPDARGAFTEVRVPNCYRQKGEHFYEKLPDFVKAEDVVRPRLPAAERLRKGVR